MRDGTACGETSAGAGEPWGVCDAAVDEAPRLFELRIECHCPPRLIAVGDLDLASAPQLKDGISGYVGATPAEEVHLDLSSVAFMDVTGARALMEVHDAIGKAGGRLVVHGLERQDPRLVEILGLRARLEPGACEPVGSPRVSQHRPPNGPIEQTEQGKLVPMGANNDPLLKKW